MGAVELHLMPPMSIAEILTLAIECESFDIRMQFEKDGDGGEARLDALWPSRQAVGFERDTWMGPEAASTFASIIDGIKFDEAMDFGKTESSGTTSALITHGGSHFVARCQMSKRGADFDISIRLLSCDPPRLSFAAFDSDPASPAPPATPKEPPERRSLAWALHERKALGDASAHPPATRASIQRL